MDNITSLIIGAVASVMISLIASLINYLLSKQNLKKISFNINNNIKANNIEICKNLINTSDYSNIDFTDVSENIKTYFDKISSNNITIIRILKIKENEVATTLFSTNIGDESLQYEINQNTDLIKVFEEKQAYYNNNIQYFINRGNRYFNQYNNWKNNYESTICCPIKNKNKIIGFLIICFKKPLNDLIDFENIKEYLETICNLINKTNLLKS